MNVMTVGENDAGGEMSCASIAGKSQAGALREKTCLWRRNEDEKQRSQSDDVH